MFSGLKKVFSTHGEGQAANGVNLVEMGLTCGPTLLSGVMGAKIVERLVGCNSSNRLAQPIAKSAGFLIGLVVGAVAHNKLIDCAESKTRVVR